MIDEELPTPVAIVATPSTRPKRSMRQQETAARRARSETETNMLEEHQRSEKEFNKRKIQKMDRKDLFAEEKQQREKLFPEEKHQKEMLFADQQMKREKSVTAVILYILTTLITINNFFVDK